MAWAKNGFSYVKKVTPGFLSEIYPICSQPHWNISHVRAGLFCLFPRGCPRGPGKHLVPGQHTSRFMPPVCAALKVFSMEGVPL